MFLHILLDLLVYISPDSIMRPTLHGWLEAVAAGHWQQFWTLFTWIRWVHMWIRLLWSAQSFSIWIPLISRGCMSNEELWSGQWFDQWSSSQSARWTGNDQNVSGTDLSFGVLLCFTTAVCLHLKRNRSVFYFWCSISSTSLVAASVLICHLFILFHPQNVICEPDAAIGKISQA